MGYSAKVLADSMSPDGVRLTTIEVTLPRIVLAEFNTHRMLSRNSASSRAIPIAKRIESVLEDPYVPDEFGSGKPGMQSGDPLQGAEAKKAREAWITASVDAILGARKLANLGVHKEYANRLLEPFLWHTIIVSATEWENFFALRCHPAASRPIRVAAEMMRDAMNASEPVVARGNFWHCPLTIGEDWREVEEIQKVSIGRSARVSYLTHEGKRDPAADVALFERLVSSGHMSPLEHVARPAQLEDVEIGRAKIGWSLASDDLSSAWFGNFRGWVQYRKLITGEDVFRGGA